ncbi:16463_t:CDS:2 [Funneliformis caledonium]|uniref:16463_t:CDS:1 n=1 Tax=Funneliformis caledonium TaxID=1117310 RepID=A0A9N9FAE0_9GLOM|nr:16463_t:CDS:2 [Funneliformis caledonium]
MEAKENCSDCGKRVSVGWCKECEIGAFKENFTIWASGNIDIDNFIKHTQLNATGCLDYLEFIDFEQFGLIEKTNKGGAFSEIYSAIWMEGPRWTWNDVAEQYIRNGPIKVALKRYNDSQNINENFLAQFYDFHRSLNGGSIADCFGITKDPSSSNYMFVMKYYDDSDLYSYIEESHGNLDWKDIITTLWGLSTEIIRVQQIGSCYGNLHGGNVLVEDGNIRITDIELFFQVERWVTAIDDSNISEFNNIDEKETLDSERNKLHRQGFYHKDIFTKKYKFTFRRYKLNIDWQKLKSVFQRYRLAKIQIGKKYKSVVEDTGWQRYKLAKKYNR